MLFSHGQHRCSADQRMLGEMFFDWYDDISDLDWVVALQQLIELFEDVFKKSHRNIQKVIKCRLHYWSTCLPNYIQVYMSILVCES